MVIYSMLGNAICRSFTHLILCLGQERYPMCTPQTVAPNSIQCLTPFLVKTIDSFFAFGVRNRRTAMIFLTASGSFNAQSIA